MNVEKENLQCALWAVIVTFPAQCHVSVLMNLAQLLAMQGIFINFVNNEWIHECMITAVSATNTNSLLSLVARGDPIANCRNKVAKIDLCVFLIGYRLTTIAP